MPQNQVTLTVNATVRVEEADEGADICPLCNDAAHFRAFDIWIDLAIKEATGKPASILYARVCHSCGQVAKERFANGKV